MQETNIKIAGAAGLGINATGRILSKLFTRSNYFTFDYTEYPSLIKGGLNTYQVRAACTPVGAPKSQDLNVFLALDDEAIKTEFSPANDCVIIAKNAFSLKKTHPTCQLLELDLISIAKSAGGKPVMANNAALGILACLYQLDMSILEELIKDFFAGKPASIATANIKVAKASYALTKKEHSSAQLKLSPSKSKLQKLHLSGNEAAGLGAIASDCRFYAAYPMTPATSLMHFVANHGRNANMLVKHAEDELSAINMTIGASYAGVRSMTGTSGGGFALMNEAISLAGISETPVIIFVSQRAGPASGMPTWTEQAELLYSVFAGHGEFPKVVLTPLDPADMYELTQTAFNLADKLQTPVIIMSDKMLSESYMSIPKNNLKQLDIDRGFITKRSGRYERYHLTASGISPRNFPGETSSPVIANSYEHDELGYTTEEIETRIKMVNKRNKKILSVTSDLPQPIVYGSKSAVVTLVSCGSTYGSLKEATDLLVEAGIKTRLIQVRTLWPLNQKPLPQLLCHPSTLICVENNSTGQLASLIRLAMGHVMDANLLKYDGRPFEAMEIVNFVKKQTDL